MAAEQRREIEQNFRAFEGYLATLLPEHAGEFALLHGGELVDLFPTAIDAMTEGYHRFGGDGLFSIQRVIDRPVDLGFISYAAGERDTL